MIKDREFVAFEALLAVFACHAQAVVQRIVRVLLTSNLLLQRRDLHPQPGDLLTLLLDQRQALLAQE